MRRFELGGGRAAAVGDLDRDVDRGLDRFLYDLAGIPSQEAASLTAADVAWRRVRAAAPTLPREFRALATMDPQALLRRAHDPRVLVVRGGRTDHPVYPTAADLASCRTATLPGQGHLSALTDPAALLAVVERKLAGSLPERAR